MRRVRHFVLLGARFLPCLTLGTAGIFLLLVSLPTLILANPPAQVEKNAAAAQFEQLNRRAAAAMAANDFAQAIPLLEQIVKLRPRLGESHANLGLAYYSVGQYEKAAESFRRALSLNSQIPHARAFLAMSLAETGKFQESLPLLEKAYAAETDKEIKRMAGIHLEQVHTALRQPLRAAETVQSLLRLYPDDPDVLYIAGKLYFQLSSQLVGRLVEVAPNSFRVRQLMGELLEANKQYGPAAEQYRKAIALEPNAPGLHYRLGLMLTRSSNEPEVWEEARQAFLAELKIDPAHARCYVELAGMLRKKGQWDEAEKLLNTGLSINADLPEAQVELGRIQVARGQLAEALSHFQEAVRLAPTSDVAHFELFRLYGRLGQEKEASAEKALYDKFHAERLRSTENVLMRLDRTAETAGEEPSPSNP